MHNSLVQKYLRWIGHILLTLALIEIPLGIYGKTLFFTTLLGAICVVYYSYSHRDE